MVVHNFVLNPMCTFIFSFSTTVYRLLSYAVLHRNLVHFAINMVGLLAFSPRLETVMGSFRYGHLALVVTGTVGLIYCMGAALAYFLLGIKFSFWKICTIGSTSPMLCLAVIHIYCFSVSPILAVVRGLEIPQTILPPVILMVTQLLPTTSFWCNFAGIAAGYVYVHGFGQQYVQLSQRVVTLLEGSMIGRFFSRFRSFVSCPDIQLPTQVKDTCVSLVLSDPQPKSGSHSPAEEAQEKQQNPTMSQSCI